MNIITEVFSIITQTVNTFLPPLVNAMFSFKMLFDSLKEQIIAAGLGVPVIVVSIGSGIVAIVSIIIKIFK